MFLILVIRDNYGLVNQMIVMLIIKNKADLEQGISFDLLASELWIRIKKRSNPDPYIKKIGQECVF